MNAAEKKKLIEYLNEVHPVVDKENHPFIQFDYSEIVIHTDYGPGVITGFRIPDEERDFLGLGVQFVVNGQMTAHRVFNPKETFELEKTGIVFNIKKHSGQTLEEIIEKA